MSTGFKVQHSFNRSSIKESPPSEILQTARVLTKRNVLTYNLPLQRLGDYYVILYFAGILPVYPSFDLSINEDIVETNFTLRTSEVSALYFTRNGIKNLNITFKSNNFYPQVNAIEVYEIIDIPKEASSTTGSY